MSGLMQRLAGQAMGAQANGTTRIRPAASVHAQLPIGLPSEDRASQQLPSLRPDTASQSEGLREVGANPIGRAKEHFSVVHSMEVIRDRVTASTPQPALAARADSKPVPREESRRRDQPDFARTTPQPLLDEVEAASQPSVIKPAPQPQPAVIPLAGGLRAEPAEVHVHIGRIDVIAAPETAPPKKTRAAPARNTLPLADYLARRRPL